jgi:hypothetical protein
VAALGLETLLYSGAAGLRRAALLPRAQRALEQRLEAGDDFLAVGELAAGGRGADLEGAVAADAVASRASSRSRWVSSRLGEPATSKLSVTRVSALLACCPPGPPLVLKLKVSSLSGMASSR